jgi:hypothetical protein
MALFSVLLSHVDWAGTICVVSWLESFQAALLNSTGILRLCGDWFTPGGRVGGWFGGKGISLGG